MYRFIHVCQDEKFINSGFNQFEELYPGQNILYVYGSKHEELTHIRVDRSRIRFVDLTDDFLNDLPEKSILIFHSIPNKILYVLPKIRKDVKVLWILFGFEIYSDPNLYDESVLLDSKTLALMKSNPVKLDLKANLKNVLYPVIRFFNKNWKLSPQEEIAAFKNRKLEAFSRVDYFAFCYYEEYLNLTNILKIERPFFDFYYFPLQKMVDINTPIEENKTNIMVGHSGFPNGNHLDILDKINNYDLDFSNIYIPISYGDNKYKNDIKEHFLNQKRKIKLIEDFVPLNEYNIFLNSVKVAIFNNRRQQAVGNIISLLYFGAKIFLSNTNTFYHFLKREGVIIYSYENDLDEGSIQLGLSIDQITHNRNILKRIFDEDKLKSDLHGAINRLL